MLLGILGTVITFLLTDNRKRGQAKRFQGPVVLERRGIFANEALQYRGRNGCHDIL